MSLLYEGSHGDGESSMLLGVSDFNSAGSGMIGVSELVRPRSPPGFPPHHLDRAAPQEVGALLSRVSHLVSTILSLTARGR
jgi:hypothetical protein